MKTLSVLLLLFVSTMSFGQVIAKPNAKLLDAAIEQYLNEMKSKFKIAPSEFIIEVADKSIYQNVKKKVGSSTIITKTKKELQDYSNQKAGKNIGFFVIDVEKVGDKYIVDIMDDGIKSNGGDFIYDSFGAGRACELTFSANFTFETIDCLLLATDPQ
jgi:hypothetical protein